MAARARTTASLMALGVILLLLLSAAAHAEKPYSRAIEADLARIQQYMVSHTRAEQAASRSKDIYYLSGPISSGGKGSVLENLRYGWDVARRLREAGKVVISPFEVEHVLRIPQSKVDPELRSAVDRAKHWSHSVFMELWARVLADPVLRPHVKGMVTLPGASSSIGATQEEGWFKRWSLPVLRFHERGDGKFRLRRQRYDTTLSLVEHTLLGPTSAEIVRREARWARKKGVRAMVVRPEFAGVIGNVLKHSNTIATAVIGFPTEKFQQAGRDWQRVPTARKLEDAKRAIEGVAAAGGKKLELDMIIDVHKLLNARSAEKAGHTRRAGQLYRGVKRDIDVVVASAKALGEARGVDVKVKVIVETSQLDEPLLRRAAAIVKSTRALAIKTSTGYGPRGASPADVRTMRDVVGNTKLIKASGGVDAHTLPALRQAGAHLFGMSGTRDLYRITRGLRVRRRARSRGSY
ncbi:MAG: hypothetical protein KC503_00895 [Myxococcales bacterium]|nr:hypothetical protein [Myxococcales bacterium]